MSEKQTNLDSEAMKKVVTEIDAEKAIREAREREKLMLDMADEIKSYKEKLADYEKAMREQKKVFESTLEKQNEKLDEMLKDRLRGRAQIPAEKGAKKETIEDIEKELGIPIRKM